MQQVGSSIKDIDFQVNSVNHILWMFIKRKMFSVLVPAFSLIVLVVAGSIYTSLKFTPNIVTGLFFSTVVVVLGLYKFLKWVDAMDEDMESAFLEQFAQKNNFIFDRDGKVDEPSAAIFKLRGQLKVFDVIKATYSGHVLQLFNTSLLTSTGKSTVTFYNTVISIDMGGSLPKLFLMNKHVSFMQPAFTEAFSTTNTISLEGDFNKFFTLYGAADKHIEALEVFSPDTMEIIQDSSRHYAIEFSGSKVFIYAIHANSVISNSKDLAEAFALAKKLITKLAPLASRL